MIVLSVVVFEMSSGFMGGEMYFDFGSPLSLKSLDVDPVSIKDLKSKYEILIIDDNPFPVVETLRRNGFRVREMRDIDVIEDVNPYPIIACDIEGIGKKLRPGTANGGFYVLKEIRKYYPDKYLIQYSTKPQDIDSRLTKADVIFPKDTGIEIWQEQIENSLQELGNPKKRWLKVRRRLSDEGVDAYELFKLEQAYIKDLLGNGKNRLESEGRSSTMSPELRKLIINFALTTVSMGVKEMLK